MKQEIVALVPVKGASERIKNKNRRPFYNTNLYELKLNQLKSVKGFANIIVSSENQKILDIAKSKGFDVHARDSKYSTSDIPMSRVYSYIASEIGVDNIAWVNVTNPLAGPEIYEQAIKHYNSMGSEFDCLLSAYKVQDYLFHKEKPVNFQPNPWPKSQDLSEVCALSFVINILKGEDMVKWGSCVGTKPYFFYLDPVISKDVDFQEDFEFCEMIYKQKAQVS